MNYCFTILSHRIKGCHADIVLLVLYYNQPPTAPDERQTEMESRFINIMIIKEERQHICPKITRGPAQVGAWLRDVMKSPFAKTNTGPSWWDEEDPNGQQIEIKQILYTYVSDSSFAHSQPPFLPSSPNSLFLCCSACPQLILTYPPDATNSLRGLYYWLCGTQRRALADGQPRRGRDAETDR